MHSVARGQLPTPAALNELAEASPDPTDGIFSICNSNCSCLETLSCTFSVLESQSEITRFVRCKVQQRRIAEAIASPTRPLSTGNCERGISASPVVPIIQLSPEAIG